MENNNVEKRPSYYRRKKRQKIVAIFASIIAITLIILTLVIQDFWEKAFALVLIFGIVFFIPMTITIMFSSHETLWDKMYDFFNKF